MRALRLATTALLLGPATLPAQSPLAERILGVKDGTVRLSYEVREGICGDGENFIRDRRRGENHYISFDEGRTSSRNWRNRPCEPGPARVLFLKSGGMTTRVRLYVGGDWGPAESNTVDLGQVAAPAAARALLAVAARERRADKAIFAAIIADSVEVWPELLTIAKNDEIYRETRKSAVFWLSQAAGDAATKGLTELVDDAAGDREIRESAVFALSQRPSHEGIPVLIRVARTNRDPEVRRKALFWLGQSDDPRVLQLFEEILTKR